MGDLPDPFSMRDVLARIAAEDISEALSWLYVAIERGRVTPLGSGTLVHYRFVGRRRDGDRFARPAPARVARV